MQKLKQIFIPHKRNGYRPSAIRGRGLLVFAMYIFTFQTIFNFQVSGKFSVLGVATNINTSDLLSYTNNERSAGGLPSYSSNVKLSLAAQSKAEHMIENDYWSHYAPDGTSPWDFINAQHYTYQRAGENLAYGFATSSGVLAGWMNSPAHKANVMDNGFTQVGFGIASGTFQGSDNTVVVAMYGEPIHSITTISAPSVPALTTQPPQKTTTTLATKPTPKELAIEPVETASQPKTIDQSNDNKSTDSNNHRLLARLADDGGIVVTGETASIDVATGTISNFQALFSGQANWSMYMVAGGMLAMALIYFIRHIQSLLQIAVHGEHFVIGHPTLEASIVYIAIWLIMFATYGSIL